MSNRCSRLVLALGLLILTASATSRRILQISAQSSGPSDSLFLPALFRNYSPTLLYPSGKPLEGVYSHVVAHGPHLLAVRGSRLELLELSDPDRPRRVSQSPEFDEDIGSILASGDIAYLSMRGRLRVLDLGGGMQQIGDLELPSKGGGLALDSSNALLYIAAGGCGVWQLDLSVPGLPALVGQVVVSEERLNPGPLHLRYQPPDTNCFATASPGLYDVAFQDGYLYVAHNYAGLVVLDASDPDDLEQVAYRYILDSIWVDVRDDRACVIQSNGTFDLLDVSDPRRPRMVAYLSDSKISSINHILMAGTRLFVSWENIDAGVRVLDVRNPAEMGISSEFRFADRSYPYMTALLRDRLYVAAGRAGLYVVDVSTRH